MTTIFSLKQPGDIVQCEAFVGCEFGGDVDCLTVNVDRGRSNGSIFVGQTVRMQFNIGVGIVLDWDSCRQMRIALVWGKG